jgi:hypothetical protein
VSRSNQVLPPIPARIVIPALPFALLVNVMLETELAKLMSVVSAGGEFLCRDAPTACKNFRRCCARPRPRMSSNDRVGRALCDGPDFPWVWSYCLLCLVLERAAGLGPVVN